MVRTNDIVNIGLPLPTAFAVGVFDGLHIGHREVINNALKQKENGLMTGVFTFAWDDEETFFKKDFKYISTQRTKENTLEKMGIDYLVSPTFKSIKNYTCEDFVNKIIVRALNAKIISCGYDFTFGKDKGGNAETLKEMCKKKGVEVIITPAVKNGDEIISSTSIREFIVNGEMQKARKMLGENYFIDFKVVQGNRIGTKVLSFPTINQKFPENHIVPKFGVYATKVYVGGKSYVGATNVGVKPTIGSDITLCETYINGYSGDLYGQNVKVEFLEHIRPETKFDSLDELKAQIKKDKQKSIEIYEKYNKK